MQIGEQNDAFTWFVRIATVALVIALLRFAQDVLIPIAFAGLLAFLLSPLVVRLTRWRLPKTAAIIITVSLAFGVIGAVGWIVTSQAISLVRELPNYEQNLHRKISTLTTSERPAFVSRVAGMVTNLQRDLKKTPPARAAPPPESTTEPKPVPVEVKAAEATPWKVARELVAPILGPLGIAGIVIVFVVAMLFQREDLRDRVIKLVSAGQLNVATQALDDAANRVSRYLRMQFVVNATYGIPIGLALYFIGVPNALLWGLLAGLLRFIPFLGPWIAASFPILLAIAVDPGWTMLFYVAGAFILMELISNNIVEVVLYGASTGISNLALLVAAVFWTWLWGAAGLVLSTPLTVCLLVLGNYVPGLNFLKMLLGSEPVLEPPAQFYQRMLSMESEDMLDLALKYIEQHSLEEFYEAVFIPALVLSEEDRHRGSLSDLRQQFIFQASRELIDELERQEDSLGTSTTDAAGPAAPATQPAPPTVLGLPARDEADELVALMLCHLLRRRGISAAAQTTRASIDDAVKAIRQYPIESVFISGLPPSTSGAVRQTFRRLRAQCPTLRIVAGIWRHDANIAELQDRLRVAKPEEIVTTLQQAMARLEKHSDALAPRSAAPAAGASEDTPSQPPLPTPS